MKRTSKILPLLLLIVLLFSMVVALSIGVVRIPMDTIWQLAKAQFGHVDTTGLPASYGITLFQLRLPRIVMSVIVGAALAACGCVFQSIFRNPICDPYVLGISSGSSLGGAISFILGWDVFYFGVTIPALITGLLTLFVILGISKMSRRRSIETLLLVGIAINFLISAVITLLVVMHQREMHKIYFWTMGSLASISWSEVLMMTVMAILCVIPFFFYSKDLNIMQMGEDVAKNLGVNTKRVAYVTLIFSSLLIATAVSCCGVIGFIGLIIPHVSRMLFGNNMRSMFTYSLILGAFFLLIADTLARTLAIPAELPVGSITALAGAPYFLFLLLRQKKV